MKALIILITMLSIFSFGQPLSTFAETDIDHEFRIRDLEKQEKVRNDAQVAQQAQQKAAEAAAAKQQSEAAYQASRNARIKKVQRATGKKVKSWQVLNR